jgi:hypothetical protein
MCTCNKVPITGLKLHVVTGITPIKVGFIGSANNPNSQVYYGLSPFLEKTR